MILEAFEKELYSKWEEFIVWNSSDQKRSFYSLPLPLAFSALEHINDEGSNGEVIIDPELEKHWDVIMREYSISRNAAEALMFLSKQCPMDLSSCVLKESLDELAKAGVVDVKTAAEACEYVLSHDFLRSVVFGSDFAEMWKETQRLRSTRKRMEEYKSTPLSDDGKYDF